MKVTAPTLKELASNRGVICCQSSVINYAQNSMGHTSCGKLEEEGAEGPEEDREVFLENVTCSFKGEKRT